MKTFLLVPLSVLIIFSSTAQVYVKQDATGNNDGTSWLNAYTNLDSALSKSAGGQVWVAQGIYKPGYTFNDLFKPYNAFKLDKKIAMYGGFKGSEKTLSERDINKYTTVLSGDLGIAGDDLDNTPRVIVISGEIDSTTVLDGFTITKSHYTNGDSYANGAVYIHGPGDPVIRNCNINENFGFNGGGIYVRNSSPLITNNTIINNVAFTGAGIICDDYLANPKIVANRISNNQCKGGYSHLAGGAIMITAYCSPYIYGNTIENNTASYGGAISNESNYEVTIINNIIAGNSAANDGGAVYINAYATRFTNNLVVGNYAGRSGGALYVDYCSVNLVNNTIVNNSSADQAGAMYLTAANMIVSNNIIHSNRSRYSRPIQVLIGRADWFPKFDYNNIQDGSGSIYLSDSTFLPSVWKAGNISQDPGFVDTLNYNFQLTSLSANINKGNPDTASFGLPLKDIALNNRLAANRVDLGCYEFNNGVNTSQDFSIEPHVFNLKGWSDTSVSLNIKTTGNWTASNSADWINPGKIAGSGPALVPLGITKNLALEEGRSSKIYLTSAKLNIPGIPATINQSMGGYIIVNPDTINMTGKDMYSASFSIYSNTYWNISNESSWLHIGSYPGTGNSIITFTADANYTGNTRYQRLVILHNFSNPAISDTVIIVQAPTQTKLCPGGGASLASGITGATYQWQVNMGNGFINIVNNSNYSGVNTAVLKLTSVPSSWYGYQFSCKTDGSLTGNVYTVQISNTWTGTTTTWETTSNWSCGTTPDINTDVEVLTGNVVISSNVTVRSLALGPNASLTVKARYHLTVLH